MTADENELLVCPLAVASKLNIGQVSRVFELDPPHFGTRLCCMDHEDERPRGGKSGAADEEEPRAARLREPGGHSRGGRRR